MKLISNTKTTSGLTIRAVIDHNKYKTGIEIPEKDYKTINIERDQFHGEWNYTIKPRNKRTN